jgi:hypothetical protein
MPIPDMPSEVRVYYPWGVVGDPQAIIPARIVPMVWLRGGRPYVGAYTGVTHWMDVEAGIILPVAAEQVNFTTSAVQYQYDVANAALVIWCDAPRSRAEYFFTVAREDRYPDTVDWYMRYYLHRIREDEGWIDSPC